MIINTNNGSSMAARILGESTSALQKSLSRLSSGSKIASPSDDAAGTAVSMKMGAQVNRIQAAKDNIGNAISYSQTQDSFLDKIGNALDRMSELAMLAQDETKTDSDRALYDKEFQKLDEFIFNIRSKTFNGVSLFSGSEISFLSVTVADNGTTFGANSIDLSVTAYDAITGAALETSAGAATALGNVRTAISALATDRAVIGANVARLETESSALAVQKDNVAAARSRIYDVDVAEESANFARQQILVQSGTAMLAQANVLPQSALRLIG
jgi:flagellin